MKKKGKSTADAAKAAHDASPFWREMDLEEEDAREWAATHGVSIVGKSYVWTDEDIKDMISEHKEEDDVEDEDYEDTAVQCEGCGKKSTLEIAGSYWVSFGTGNSRPPLYVFVCERCEKSKKKMRKAIDAFLVGLDQLRHRLTIR